MKERRPDACTSYSEGQRFLKRRIWDSGQSFQFDSAERWNLFVIPKRPHRCWKAAHGTREQKKKKKASEGNLRLQERGSGAWPWPTKDRNRPLTSSSDPITRDPQLPRPPPLSRAQHTNSPDHPAPFHCRRGQDVCSGPFIVVGVLLPPPSRARERREGPEAK